MGVHATIPAAVQNSQPKEHTALLQNYNQPQSTNAAASILTAYPSYSQALQSGSVQNQHGSGGKPGPSRVTLADIRQESYGSVSDDEGGQDVAFAERGGAEYDDEMGDDDDDDYATAINVTWKYMSRLYLLVPIITLIWFILLVLLVTFAWPPSKAERQKGQQYPHPILFHPFLIGIFASCTVQTIRVPTYVVVSWLGFNTIAVEYLSRTLHTIVHELLRLSTLPLIVPSPTSGFHSSYYLGLGWGVAEVTWGIVQGWEQLAVYKEVMLPSEPREDVDGSLGAKPGRDVETESQRAKREGMLSSVEERDENVVSDEDECDELYDDQGEDEETADQLGEAELERKVEILERMRARRELEEVIGVPYPNIPFPLHLLWRLDGLLLNLGLTLILSAFYFNPTPIYRHFPSPSSPDREPSQWLWLTWLFVTVVHVGVSLVWKVVGRVGVGAVTWGGLIVALGSVFAGLGCWGGLV